MAHSNETAEKFLKGVYFVTGNPLKVRDVQAVLGTMRHVELDLPEIQELEPRKVVVAKAKAAVEQGYSPALIEDTSMSLAALNGLPGPLIKWFLKALGGDGLYHLAAQKKNVQAEVRTIFGLALAPQTIIYGEGVIHGQIVAPRGGGFGWDAIFQPKGSSKTFGEMEPEERSANSMRILALQDLKVQITRFPGALAR